MKHTPFRVVDGVHRRKAQSLYDCHLAFTSTAPNAVGTPIVIGSEKFGG
jgi:hypothetical protein